VVKSVVTTCNRCLRRPMVLEVHRRFVEGNRSEHNSTGPVFDSRPVQECSFFAGFAVAGVLRKWVGK
jgi:hypothetical protein